MNTYIRRVQKGDETVLAYIQTESWKAAFSDLLDAETLARNTDFSKSVRMFRHLLEENIGNGYLLFVEEKPHCMAYWDAARDKEFAGKAELISIHSLKENRRKGYGRRMMDYVLKEIRAAGYSGVVLWVFRDNVPARAFYEAGGFHWTGTEKKALGTTLVLYSLRIE